MEATSMEPYTYTALQPLYFRRLTLLLGGVDSGVSYLLHEASMEHPNIRQEALYVWGDDTNMHHISCEGRVLPVPPSL